MHVCMRESTKGSWAALQSWVKVKLKVKVADISPNPLLESAQLGTLQLLIVTKDCMFTPQTG